MTFADPPQESCLGVQSAPRRPRDWRRCAPPYQAPRVDPNAKRRPCSSSRRSEYLRNRQRHSWGIVQLGKGRAGALAASRRESSSALTAPQALGPPTIVTAANFRLAIFETKWGAAIAAPRFPQRTIPVLFLCASPPSIRT